MIIPLLQLCEGSSNCLLRGVWLRQIHLVIVRVVMPLGVVLGSPQAVKTVVAKVV